MTAARVRFLTRERCELCEEAASFLRRVAPRLGVGIIEVDVDDTGDEWARFGDRIPVLLDESRNEVLALGRWRKLRVLGSLIGVRLRAGLPGL